MASLKTDAQLEKRSVLNTTINKDVFEEFKKKCKQSGIPMNIIIESFMAQYNNGDFQICIRKNKIVIDENNEQTDKDPSIFFAGIFIVVKNNNNIRPERWKNQSC